MQFACRLTRRMLLSFGLLVAVAAPSGAFAASSAPIPASPPGRPAVSALGSLKQLPGRAGCVTARSQRPSGCARARALEGPGPLLGSHAIAVSPDGRNVYVASAGSNAVAIFRRNASTGALTQVSGRAGCIASGGGSGCARARALRHPNSLAVSPDGRDVYVTSLASDSVVTLRRNRSTGGLAQVGCVARTATDHCTAGRGLDGPDVVAVSPDGANVYVGSFIGSGLAVFSRGASTGGLTQLYGAAGCWVQTPTSGCTTAIGMADPEGIAVSPDGASVYVAAPGSDAVDTFTRDSGGALAQAADGTGCVASGAITGCAPGAQLAGADAVTVSPDGTSVYVTSLESDAIASFGRASSGALTQLSGTSACVINVLAVGCSLGRQLSGPEGVVVSPGATNLYAVSYFSGSLGVLDRDASSGAVAQKTRATGCLAAGIKPGCLRGRALRGAGAVTISPDGKNVYVTAYKSNAVDVFKRVNRTKPMRKGS